MKLMRSRFRLISLLLACVFLLTTVICAASVIKQSGIAFPSAGPASVASASPAPESLQAPETASPAPPELSPDETEAPGTDNSLVSEYNLFGL